MCDRATGGLINCQTTTHVADDRHMVIPVHGIASFGLCSATPMPEMLKAAGLDKVGSELRRV